MILPHPGAFERGEPDAVRQPSHRPRVLVESRGQHHRLAAARIHPRQLLIEIVGGFAVPRREQDPGSVGRPQRVAVRTGAFDDGADGALGQIDHRDVGALESRLGPRVRRVGESDRGADGGPAVIDHGEVAAAIVRVIGFLGMPPGIRPYPKGFQGNAGIPAAWRALVQPGCAERFSNLHIQIVVVIRP